MIRSTLPPASNGQDPMFLLMQVTSAAFPTGSFTQSYGFESWLDERRIRTAADAEERLHLWLRHNLAKGDAVAVTQAFRHTLYGEEQHLAALNRQVGAVKFTREGREASEKSGQAWLAAFRDIFELEPILRLDERLSADGQRPHQAVVYGTGCAGLGFSEVQAAETFLWTSLSSLAAVIARLLPIGQVELQRMITAALPRVRDCTEIARTTPPDRMSASYSALDVAAMHHEVLATRLCIS